MAVHGADLALLDGPVGAHQLAAHAADAGLLVDDGHVCGHTAYVNPGVCQGCGTCQAVCLSKSVELQTFTDEQVYSEINALCAWE